MDYPIAKGHGLLGVHESSVLVPPDVRIYVEYFYGYYYDYSIFSEDALAIWTSEAANQAGTVGSVQSTETAQQAAESTLGVPIGGGHPVPADKF